MLREFDPMEAKQFLKAGYFVSISNSRGPQTLKLQEHESGAKAMNTEEALADADIVVLAVPMASIRALEPLVKVKIQPSATVIDTCNYYPSRDGRIQELDDGMPDSVWVSQTLAVPVVKALNNIIADNMVTSTREKGSAKRVTLPVSGDDSKALDTVAVTLASIAISFGSGSETCI